MELNKSKMNYSIYAESTPNPKVMKFVSNKILVNKNIEIIEKKDASKIPIAAAIFKFPFVKSIFISNNFIAITKIINLEWPDIAMQLRIFISDFLNNEGLEIKEDIIKEVDNNNSKSLYASNIEKQIAQVIEEYIQPAVESDGGAISLKQFDEGVVSVNLKGACSGCPSASLTLKQGVERLLKEKFPNQIKEVIAYEE